MRGFPELFNYTGLAPEILLAADEDDGQTSAEMHDFRNPLETEDMSQRGARDMINNQKKRGEGTWNARQKEAIAWTRSSQK